MILFLDFDGVLHPEALGKDEKDWLFCRLPLLHEILRTLPRLDVVFSTSWRLVYPRADLVDMVSTDAPDLAARFIGATPEIEARTRRQGIIGQRQDEIQHWLELSGRERESWLALDDYPDFFWPGCEGLYRVESATGLTPEDVPGIVECLRW